MEYTIIVQAGAAEGGADQVDGAPYARCAMGEYFMFEGKRALMYDDLSKHADAYRQLATAPPRAARPTRGMSSTCTRGCERACKLSDKKGGGSLTALGRRDAGGRRLSLHPNERDLESSPDLPRVGALPFGRGRRSTSASRSRAWPLARIKAINKVAGSLKLDLSQYRELEAFAQFAPDSTSRRRRSSAAATWSARC